MLLVFKNIETNIEIVEILINAFWIRLRFVRHRFVKYRMVRSMMYTFGYRYIVRYRYPQ